MKRILVLLSFILFIACKDAGPSFNVDIQTQQVAALLDSLNSAAARADYATYFSYYADNAVFMGTDATERWNKEEFMKWSKPYFDRGKAWSFQTVKRTVYFDTTGSLAWFDELLSTQMKICRGSGVAVRQGSDWKLKQYVLSMTVPNALVDTIVPLKTAAEDSILNSLRK
jgi:ketosteroid isomerase-like protein